MRRLVAKISQEIKIKKDEAELIIAALLDKPRFELYLNHQLSPGQRKLIWLKLLQLKSGVPIEYITKKIQFRDYNLTINPGVFIPRLETEYFIELIAKKISNKPKKILEIGTGCGAIAIALAHLYPDAEIIATDISNEALDNAQINIKRFNLEKRIELVYSNLFENINTHFDLIVSNPPYVPSSRLINLPKSVRDFEPLRAINGGPDGNRFIRALINQGLLYLNENGVIALEIDETAVKPLNLLLKDKLTRVLFLKDQFGKYRYLFIGDEKR